ncbi:hypothetical protein KCP77_12725 [Salmonella enterica subsp. enterica]|nr:hypothetical protein KCP77_12725 [Salmonella enterica subsp. enterica]
MLAPTSSSRRPRVLHPVVRPAGAQLTCTKTLPRRLQPPTPREVSPAFNGVSGTRIYSPRLHSTLSSCRPKANPQVPPCLNLSVRDGGTFSPRRLQPLHSAGGQPCICRYCLAPLMDIPDRAPCFPFTGSFRSPATDPAMTEIYTVRGFGLLRRFFLRVVAAGLSALSARDPLILCKT